MDGEPSGAAAGGQRPAGPPVGSDATVPDPVALRSDRGEDGEPPPVPDPAAPPPADAEDTQQLAGTLDTGEPHKPVELMAAVAYPSEETAAPQAEDTNEAPPIPENAGDGAASDPAEKATFLVPDVSVEGAFSTPESPVPDVADGPLDLAPHSAPPPATARPEAPEGRGRAGSAMAGVSGPTWPSACPGFRPYSETPVYSDSGAAASPPPPEPPPDQPCSGDWHRKTIDDLIAMDVPDVRIPRCVNSWGACEIRGWLRGLGLEQYVEAMLNNGICGRRLCLLTASNLPRMGITDWRHIRAITGSVRSLLSVDDYVPYERQLARPPPGPMTRALYLQCARPTGPPPPSSARYRDFLRQHGFLDVLLELTNRPVVKLPQPQSGTPLYREIAVPPVPSLAGPSRSQSRGESPASRPRSGSPTPRPAQGVSTAP